MGFNERWNQLSDAELMAIANGEKPSTAEDVIKGAGVGLAKGALGIPGFIGDMSELGAQGLNALTGFVGKQFGMDLRNPALDRPPSQREGIGSYAPPTTDQLQQQVEGVTGKFYQPQTTAGQYAQRIGEFLPASGLGPGGIARKAVQGVASAVGSKAAEDLAPEPYKPLASLGGAIAGGVLAPRVLNPLAPSAERQALADTLAKQMPPVPITAGQLSGNPLVKALESPVGGVYEDQLNKLGQAAMSKAGGRGPATREGVANLEREIGARFDALERRNTAYIDKQTVSDLQKTLTGYTDIVPPVSQSPVIKKLASDIEQSAGPQGNIPGNVYKSLRTRINTAQSAASDPDTIKALAGLKDTLDGTMERSIAKNNPADLGEWSKARSDYRNSLVIKHAQGRGTEATVAGGMTPGSLNQAVNVLQGTKNRAKGKGDFADLADAAALLTPLPNSGTTVRSIASGLGAYVGSRGGPESAALGAIAGAGGQYALINNPLSQAYLKGRIPGQRSMVAPNTDISMDALVQALQRTSRLVQTPDGFSYYTDDPR